MAEHRETKAEKAEHAAEAKAERAEARAAAKAGAHVRPCERPGAEGKFEAVFADGTVDAYAYRTEAEAQKVLDDKAAAEKAAKDAAKDDKGPKE